MSWNWVSYFAACSLLVGAFIGFMATSYYRDQREGMGHRSTTFCVPVNLGDTWGHRCDYPDAVCYVRDRNMACRWKDL